MTGIRKSDNASPSRGRSRMWSNVHDLFHVRNMFYFQIGNVHCAMKPSQQEQTTGQNRKRRQKTNASPEGEAQVMGGFPKRSTPFIQNLRGQSNPYFQLFSSHGGGQNGQPRPPRGIRCSRGRSPIGPSNPNRPRHCQSLVAFTSPTHPLAILMLRSLFQTRRGSFVDSLPRPGTPLRALLRALLLGVAAGLSSAEKTCTSVPC